MKSPANTKVSGAAIALAAAGITACSDAPTKAPNPTTADLAHCYKVNSCKGHNDCKTAENACGGHGSCKGKGFIVMPTKACEDVGGMVKDEWRGTISTESLVKCYDVNTCKGHNDCATANNACKGQATCKGSGWVYMPTKACTDLGGKEKS